jgi:ferredoxin
MPAISSELCTLCMKCVKDCPSDAIEIQTWHINNSCIHCGHCVAICPEKAVSPDHGDVITLNGTGISAWDYTHFTAGIRSCRSYKNKPVPREMVLSLVGNMQHYPSASNKRSVKITMVTTPDQVQLLNDMTAEKLMSAVNFVTKPVVANLLNTFAPKLGIPGIKAYKQKFHERQKTNPSQICHSAPVVMLFHGPSVKYSMAKDDAVIWATNTTHLAHAMGLGSCFIGFIVKAMERSKTMRNTFQIPPDHQVFTALTIGFPKVTYVNQVSRQKPESNIL